MDHSPNFLKSKGKHTEHQLDSEKFNDASQREERKEEEEDLDTLKKDYLREKMRRHAEKNKVTAEDIEDMEELIR